MNIEEALEILWFIDDEVGDICCKELKCQEKCKNDICFIHKAIETTKDYIKQLQADKNKLINYIAIREDMDFKDVCKKFEVGE